MTSTRVARPTPGPWELVGGTMVRTSKVYVARAQLGRPTSEVAANARLIAAAPDLLDACRVALPALIADGRQDLAMIVRAAIAKAEGEAKS